jgi:hypothetical protein
MTFVVVGMFVLAAVAVGVWIRTSLRERREKSARDVLLSVAPRLGLPEAAPAEPVLRFVRRGFPAALSIHAGARLNVEISFKLPDEDAGWVTVSSVGFRRAFLDQLGLKDHQVGDAEFDRRLEVWGEDAALLGERLVPAVRSLLLQVDRRWDFFMRLTPRQLTLRAHVDPLDRFQVETLAGMAYQLLDLFDPRSPGDLVISTVQETLSEETRCPVCGTPLSRGSVVRCSKCRSAHHADCWKFNGLCATFACGSTHNVR